jgi:nitroimidazol reductase NimA-like FMN-containing flavoprotein (pyridoxamine 5'-phosphate oxidase superfamily)
MDEGQLEELSPERCIELLSTRAVGRIAVVQDGYPIVVPVNYRVVSEPDLWLVIRTRHGGVIEQSSARIAFQIDSIDPEQQEGWSVLVRGALRGLTDDSPEVRAHIDPHPWLTQERDLWLAIQPLTITGRALHAGAPDWTYHPADRGA